MGRKGEYPAASPAALWGFRKGSPFTFALCLQLPNSLGHNRSVPWAQREDAIFLIIQESSRAEGPGLSQPSPSPHLL